MIAARINSNSKKIILLPISFQKSAERFAPRVFHFQFVLRCGFYRFFAPRADFIYRVFCSAPRIFIVFSAPRFPLSLRVLRRAADFLSFFQLRTFCESAAGGERLYWLVSSFCISSSDLFFVTGSFRANTKVRAAIIAKKQKVGTDNPLSTRVGNTHVSIAHHAQCVMLPKTCPLARTLVGKTSDIRTHITAPRDIANAAIYSISENNI